jgi:putative hydrolase of the HAD superfamily
MGLRAVIFDLGGVVFGSPLHAIAEYERELGLPVNAINRVVVGSGPGGAWSRLERGELTLDAFQPAFEADCAAVGIEMSAAEMMRRIALVTAPRPIMLGAIGRLRAAQLKVGALTNNWVSDGPDDMTSRLRPFFDVIVESAAEGMRKPDPRIYRLTCERLEVAPAEVVFLDDIGANLKPARELGMTTIKVVEPAEALAELESVLGVRLGDPMA